MDEYDVIRAITRKADELPRGYLPIGDDVAFFPVGGKNLLLKADMLVGKTDVPRGMGWRRAARKAVTMCVSDFAAKGARPDSFMVSLGLPRATTGPEVEQLASGFADAASEWQVKMVGGDTSEAGDLVIDCLMAGFADGMVRRDTAKEGELIVTTGTFGETSAGLRILLHKARAPAALRKLALAHVYEPKARLALGVSVAPCLSSSIDSSDGLAISLHTISEMSKVGMVVTDLPCTKDLVEFAALNHYQLEELVLNGGEEYEIVGTVPRTRLAEARRRARAAGGDLIVIGKTTKGRAVRFSDGREIEKKGWIHFVSEP